MISAPSRDDRFNLEVVKLLLKVAWVDREVDELLRRVDAGQPLPEPDLATLRQRADDVMTAARALVLSDGKIKAEESALLKQLAATLKG